MSKIPKQTVLNKLAVDCIKQRDDERGEGWSDSTQDIANLMEKFTAGFLEKIEEMILNGTRNRRHWNGWEQGVLYQCAIRDTLAEETKNVS